MISNPKISVVILAKNEENLIKNTILQFIEQANYEKIEILVVNDGSTDSTEKILAQLNYSNLKTIRTNGIGITKARNLGAKYTKGEILVFSDAHMELSNNWAKNLADYYANEKFCMATPLIYDLSHNFKTYGCTLNKNFSLDYLHINPFNNYSPIAIGCFMIFSRDKYLELGKYDEGMNYYGYEDIELSIRCWLMGFSIRLLPEIRVGHLWKDKNNKDFDYIKNKYTILRTAYLHFNEQRIERVKKIIKSHYDHHFSEVMLKELINMINNSDTLKLQQQYRQIRINDDDWFMSNFNIPF